MGAVNMPNCTRYKPNHKLTRANERAANLNQRHEGPSFIEQIMLDAYKKEMEEDTTGQALKCARLGKREQETHNSVSLKKDQLINQKAERMQKFYQKFHDKIDTHVQEPVEKEVLK